MTWINAKNSSNLVVVAGPVMTLVETDSRPVVNIGTAADIRVLGDLITALNNPLSSEFIKAIEAGRPVDTGGGGSVRPTSGLVYPRRV